MLSYFGELNDNVLTPFFIKNKISSDSKKGNGPIKFLIPVSLHEVRLWSRILVGPFPNKISHILDEIDIDCIIGNGPTLTLLYQEYCHVPSCSPYFVSARWPCVAWRPS